MTDIVPAPTNRTTGAVTVALMAVVSAVLVLLRVFDVIHWSDAQTAAVTAEAAASIAWVGALVAHFKKGTSKEPVLLLTALGTWLSTSVATVAAFVTMTGPQTAALLGVSTAVVGLLTALFVRSQVVPMKFAPDPPDPAYIASQPKV